MAIRHNIPSENWPTEEEAQNSAWFSPVSLGPGCTARHRTWVPAMVPWRATEDGEVTPDVLDWYGRFARGRPGVIVVEATGVRDIASGPLLRISHDRFLPGLKQLVETVKENSGGDTRLLIQLIDFLTVRRRPDPEKYFTRYLKVDDNLRSRLAEVTGDDSHLKSAEDSLRASLFSAPREIQEATLPERELEALDYGYRERVWDTHLPHVKNLPEVLPERFSMAARRAREAGFDGVELHYAHAYTMAGFLSRLNTRSDGYGVTKENRVRLPLEVYRAVRDSVGTDYTVGCRFLTDEIVDGGSRIDDAAFYGLRFAEAGMNFLSLSRGGKFEDAKQPGVGWAVYPYTGPSGHECMPTVRIDEKGPFGRNVEAVGEIRQKIQESGFETPVVLAGGIHGFRQAEEILARGVADVVASARQSLADPDWFMKILSGRGGEVNRCLFTNYCEGLDQKHKQVTCQLWDRKFDKSDNTLTLSPDGRRRLLPPLWDR